LDDLIEDQWVDIGGLAPELSEDIHCRFGVSKGAMLNRKVDAQPPRQRAKAVLGLSWRKELG